MLIVDVLIVDGPAHVELAGIVQVYGAQPGIPIEVWPAQAPRAGEAGLDR